jgi:hypothetical protein
MKPETLPKPVRVCLLGLLPFLNSCSSGYEWDGSLENLLSSQPERFGTVLADPEKYRVQIIYTQIDRDKDNVPAFASFPYRVDSGEYFYPASTVKLPAVLLALEKINDLSTEGLTRNTTMLTRSAEESQTPVISDPSSPTGLPSVAHYIRKILLVSDNDAFNRLYEFLGQQPLNDALHGKGFSDARIMHRLSTPLSLEENRRTNPVAFTDNDKLIYEQAEQISQKSYVADDPIMLGKAEIVGDELEQGAKNFAEKNSYTIQDQHDVIRTVMFPDSIPADRRFRLSADDYQFVRRYMSMYPGDADIAEYQNPDDYPDGYVKFFMYGGDAQDIPRNIRIFNKVGDAYGFLTEAAYIVDVDNGVEFILAATLYTNENGTFNDDNYEYEEIGLPFMRDLGQAIYELELKRSRAQSPDLGEYRRP